MLNTLVRLVRVACDCRLLIDGSRSDDVRPSAVGRVNREFDLSTDGLRYSLPCAWMRAT